MKIVATILGSTVLLGLAGLAHADRGAPDIDETVTSVVSDPGTRTRAIAGDGNGAYLVIERLSSRGGASDQVWIEELPLGRDTVPLTELKNVRLLSIAQNTLQLEATPRVRGGARSVMSCTASLEYGRGRITVRSTSCSQGGQPSIATVQQATPAPAPPAPVVAEPPGLSTSEIAAISKACDGVFAYANERKTCLDMTVDAARNSKFPRSAVRVPAACATAFPYASSRTSCMQTSFTSVREPVELIEFCASKGTYENEKKSCLEQFAATR